MLDTQLLLQIFLSPTNTVCGGMGGGYTVFTSIRLSVHLSVHDVSVFHYLEKAMIEFHNIWQIH